MRLTEITLISVLLLHKTYAADSSSSTASSKAMSTLSSSSDSIVPSSSSSVAASTTDVSSSASSSQLSSATSSASSFTITSSSSSMPSVSTTSSSDAALSSMPSITVTSSEIETSSYNVTFSAGVPTVQNPFTQNSTLPAGTLFIIFGAFLGLVVVSLVVSRWIFWCVSNKAAKSNHDSYSKLDYNYDPSIFKEVPLKQNYAHSVYSLSSQSTSNLLGSNASMDNLVSQGQGRTYRSAMTRASRSSMFISPTEMLQLGTYDNPSSAGYLSHADSPIESPTTSNYSPREYVRKANRPPSVYMDKMLDDDLDDFDISSESSSYDQNADEKV